MYIHSFVVVVIYRGIICNLLYREDKYTHTHTHTYVCLTYAKCLPSSTLAHNKDSVLNRYLIGKHISA